MAESVMFGSVVEFGTGSRGIGSGSDCPCGELPARLGRRGGAGRVDVSCGVPGADLRGPGRGGTGGRRVESAMTDGQLSRLGGTSSASNGFSSAACPSGVCREVLPFQVSLEPLLTGGGVTGGVCGADFGSAPAKRDASERTDGDGSGGSSAVTGINFGGSK